MLVETLTTIGYGVLIGIGVSGVGYIKALPDGETFDWKKIVPAIIIGGITGAVANYNGIDFSSAGVIIADFGIIALVNSLWSTFVKTKTGAKVTKIFVQNKKKKK